ncbi:MAG: alkaline phosphatase family protein, partial [Candidatus Wallbacteria bacterium]|nr:alkaline phosphatase family protein [Candidatus Wallbacteria bacterium]
MILSKLARILVVLLALAGAAPASAADATAPLIVLGVDGLDHALALDGIRQGRLPGLARLAREGSFAPLLPTTPAESPVSWAALVTGSNPGRTGIYDFVRRVRGTYGVELATVRKHTTHLALPPTWVVAMAAILSFAGAWPSGRRGRSRPLARVLSVLVGGMLCLAACAVARIPRDFETARPARQGTAFWDVLGAAGRTTEVLWAPLEFPPRTTLSNVKLLPGLGTPDVLGTQGTYSLLTDAGAGGKRDLEMGGRVLGLDWRGDKATVDLPGPFETSCRLELAREQANHLRIAGPFPAVELASGGWTDLLPMNYPLFPGFGLHSLSRLHVAGSKGRGVRVYVSPGGFDPEWPPPVLAVSHPRDFAGQLASEHGPYTMLGWAADTMAVQDGVLDEDAFMESLEANFRQREKMLLGEAARSGWQTLFAVLEEPDRASHVLWRAADPRHPFHDAALSVRHAHSIEKVYGWIDAIVTKLRQARPD